MKVTKGVPFGEGFKVQGGTGFPHGLTAVDSFHLGHDRLRLDELEEEGRESAVALPTTMNPLYDASRA